MVVTDMRIFEIKAGRERGTASWFWCAASDEQSALMIAGRAGRRGPLTATDVTEHFVGGVGVEAILHGNTEGRVIATRPIHTALQVQGEPPKPVFVWEVVPV